jgi:hypothetical protein
MTWKRIKDEDYLYRIIDMRTQKYLGPHTPETEKLKGLRCLPYRPIARESRGCAKAIDDGNAFAQQSVVV